MKTRFITRRQWLYGTGCLGLAMASGCTTQTASLVSTDTEPYPQNAEQVLARLQKGNQRFIDNKPYHLHENASWRSHLIETQQPFATVVG